MARVYLLETPNDLVTQIYVVDKAVGDGCANARDDVRLVQFFLRTMLAPKDSYAKQVMVQPAGEQPLAIDGICGTHTVTYIKAFQQQFNKWQQDDAKGMDFRGSPMVLIEDGAVNALETGSMWSKRRHHLMTILRLNTQFSFSFGIEAHKRLHTNPRFPRELLYSLYF